MANNILFLALLGLAILACASVPCDDPHVSDFPYCNRSLSAEQRAVDLVSRMKRSEKVHMIGGKASVFTGLIPAIRRLRIPELVLHDGAQGVATSLRLRHVTCFPSALTVAQSWDSDLWLEFGEALALEQRGKGVGVALAPAAEIARVPRAGRNYESGGEDPVLAGAFAAQVVSGIQSQGVIACPKYFADSNQNAKSGRVSVEVDKKTQWELYYPPFQAAVDAGAGAVMCAGNKANGTWACESSDLLNTDLKGTMGFKGFVASDSFATHSTAAAINAGLDMELPYGLHFNEAALKIDLAFGLVDKQRLDDMVTRIVTPMFTAGLFDRDEKEGSLYAHVTSAEHRDLARRLSEASTVLMKNTGVLPLATDSRVVLIGKAAHDSPVVSAGDVKPDHRSIVTPLEGLSALSDNVTYNSAKRLESAVAEAAAADVAVVFVTLETSRTRDRKHLRLDNWQNELVAAVAAVQPNTVVVANAAGAFLMPWASSVSAIVLRGLPGQEDGAALANILYGVTNPSGKLAISFPASENDTWLQSEEQYPGVDGRVVYSEGLLVGHRWYESQGTKPLYAFGHGLSYTTFSYSGLTVDDDGTVSFKVRNTGSIAGSEVAQVYVAFPSGEPKKVLKAFKKVTIAAKSTASVSLTLSDKDLSTYDEATGAFVKSSGEFVIQVGSASDDIRVKATYDV